MKLVEEFIQSRTGDLNDCEDTYICNEHYAAVIDGATNVSGQRFAGKTPGQVAAHLIKQTIKQLPGQASIQEIIQMINNDYEQLYQELNILEEVDEKPYLRPSASLVIYSKHHHKIWMIGDCQAFYKGKNYQNRKEVDRIFEEARSVFVRAELLEGKSEEEILANDQSFAYIKPLIQKQYHFQNKEPVCPLSYAVINGYDVPQELIKTFSIPRDTTFLSMASDGYPNIYASLEESEQKLAETLQVDPLCIAENKAVRGISRQNISFDDRTYIKVEIS